MQIMANKSVDDAKADGIVKNNEKEPVLWYSVGEIYWKDSWIRAEREAVAFRSSKHKTCLPRGT